MKSELWFCITKTNDFHQSKKQSLRCALEAVLLMTRPIPVCLHTSQFGWIGHWQNFVCDCMHPEMMLTHHMKWAYAHGRTPNVTWQVDRSIIWLACMLVYTVWLSRHTQAYMPLATAWKLCNTLISTRDVVSRPWSWSRGASRTWKMVLVLVLK